MRLVWLCNFIPLAWRHYISGLFPMQSQWYQKDTRTHDQQAWNICGPHSEFKRATVACGKFKITETQNESSQNLYSWKIPKLWQVFGKFGSGWKSQNSGRFLGKLGLGLKCQNCGEQRARAKFRRYVLKHNWKTYRTTLDQGGSNPRPTLTDRTAFA